jgi:hypothetical protein
MSDQYHDPVELLAGLEAEKLQARLDAIRQEEASIRVLLRSLRARETAKRRQTAIRQERAARAS